jgi:hypothetical protein
LKNQVPALKQRSRAVETQLYEQVPQIGHRRTLVPADVDATQKGDMGDCRQWVSCHPFKPL